MPARAGRRSGAGRAIGLPLGGQRVRARASSINSVRRPRHRSRAVSSPNASVPRRQTSQNGSGSAEPRNRRHEILWRIRYLCWVRAIDAHTYESGRNLIWTKACPYLVSRSSPAKPAEAWLRPVAAASAAAVNDPARCLVTAARNRPFSARLFEAMVRSIFTGNRIERWIVEAVHGQFKRLRGLQGPDCRR